MKKANFYKEIVNFHIKERFFSFIYFSFNFFFLNFYGLVKTGIKVDFAYISS